MIDADRTAVLYDGQPLLPRAARLNDVMDLGKVGGKVAALKGFSEFTGQCGRTPQVIFKAVAHPVTIRIVRRKHHHDRLSDGST